MISIVIADDEKHICDSLRDVLTKSIAGIQVDALFYTGQSLKEYLQTQDVDLLITDIEMPGATGLEVAQLLRHSGRKTRIVIITAFQRFEYAYAALESKVDAFLIKPYSAQQMIDTIQGLVNDIQQARQEKNELSEISYFRETIRLLYQTVSVDKRTRVLLPGCHKSAWEAPCSAIQLMIQDWAQLDEPCREQLTHDLSCDAIFPTESTPTVFLGQDEGVFSYILFCADNQPCDALLRVLLTAADRQRAVSLESICTSFDAFESFLLFQRHTRLVQRYDETTKSTGLHLARLQLQATLQAMTPQELLAFAQYLKSEYCLPISSGAQDDILNSLEEMNARHAQNAKSSYLVDAAKTFVREHYAAADLSLQQTADFLRVSPAYLSRRFKEVRGISFTAYCQHIRMEKAAELLRSTSLPINTIAAAIGYDRGNTVYFRASFKSAYGMTPRQYRESAAGKVGTDE